MDTIYGDCSTPIAGAMTLSELQKKQKKKVNDKYSKKPQQDDQTPKMPVLSLKLPTDKTASSSVAMKKADLRVLALLSHVRIRKVAIHVGDIIRSFYTIKDDRNNNTVMYVEVPFVRSEKVHFKNQINQETAFSMSSLLDMDSSRTYIDGTLHAWSDRSNLCDKDRGCGMRVKESLVPANQLHIKRYTIYEIGRSSPVASIFCKSPFYESTAVRFFNADISIVWKAMILAKAMSILIHVYRNGRIHVPKFTTMEEVNKALQQQYP